MGRDRQTGDTASAYEHQLLLVLRTLPHSSSTDAVAVVLSRFGDHARGWVALAAVGAVLDRNRWVQWLSAAVAAAVTEQTSRQIKKAVRRPRPELGGLPALAGVTSQYSFPSSHTATAVAAIYTFDGLLPARVRPGLIAWAALTAISRPYLGVHYPSDVAFGAVLGYAIGRATSALRGE